MKSEEIKEGVSNKPKKGNRAEVNRYQLDMNFYNHVLSKIKNISGMCIDYFVKRKEVLHEETTIQDKADFNAAANVSLKYFHDSSVFNTFDNKHFIQAINHLKFIDELEVVFQEVQHFVAKQK